MVRSAHDGASNLVEPEHVDQTSSHDFPPVAAGSDLCDSPGGLDDLGQELLAQRGQAERTAHVWLAGQRRFRLCLRPSNFTAGVRDRRWRWIGVALSGWSEGSLICIGPAVLNYRNANIG